MKHKKRLVKTYLTKENYDKVVQVQLDTDESLTKIVSNRLNRLRW
jgi:hypothetical protein